VTSIVVVTAGLSQPSSTRLLGEQVATATRRPLAEAGQRVEIVHIELRDLAHDVVNNLLTGFPPPALATAVEQVSAADGLIVVTPIFSASYSGLFKSFFDVLDPEALAGKPVLIAATGGSQRHSLVLEYAVRPLFSYLRAEIVPTAVYAASADWGTAGSTGSALSEPGRRSARRADRARRAGAGRRPVRQPHAVPGATQPLGSNRLIRIDPDHALPGLPRGVELVRLEPVQPVAEPLGDPPAALVRPVAVDLHPVDVG
jgi:FMN reductase